eukprot:SAG22_NODE_1908_length_3330_cov_2.071804_2_plen_232_part_00
MGGLPPQTTACVVLIIIMLIAAGGARDDILAAGRTARRAGKSRAKSAGDFMGCVVVMFFVCIGAHAQMFNDPSMQWFVGVCVFWWIIIFSVAGKTEKAAKNMDAAEAVSAAEVRSEVLSETMRQMEADKRAQAQMLQAPMLVAGQYGNLDAGGGGALVATTPVLAQPVSMQPHAAPVAGGGVAGTCFCSRCGKHGSGRFCTGCGAPLKQANAPSAPPLVATSMDEVMKIRA